MTVGNHLELPHMLSFVKFTLHTIERSVMFTYSASSTSKILRSCLLNVERTGDPQDSVLSPLKGILSLRIAEAETHVCQGWDLRRSAPRAGSIAQLLEKS
jgi:hypothetical protein